MKNVKPAIIAILLLAAFALLLAACSPSEQKPALASEVVRIHIRANSNSDEDQTVKLAVRDAVTEFLTVELENCQDKQAALDTLNEDKERIAEIANSTLKANGFDYTTAVSVKNDYFPLRTYDGYVFPEGYYDALMIYLGEGVGDNWWCVAFPPLCFVPDGDGEKIVYKSWIKEKIEEIFGGK